jgi:hypothetical protein
MFNLWRPSENIGPCFSLQNFWFLKCPSVSCIRSGTLISHEIQKLKPDTNPFWIWAPYICISDCVPNNYDQSLSNWVFHMRERGGHLEISDNESNMVKYSLSLSENYLSTRIPLWHIGYLHERGSRLQ